MLNIRIEILSHMYNQFYFVAERISNKQDNNFRTYLWVASLILSLNAVILKEYISFPYFAHLNVLSIVMSAIVVCFCLFSMRGRITTKMPNLNEYYNRLKKYDKLMTFDQLEEQLWGSIVRERSERNRGGKALRCISWLLILSFMFLMASMFCLYLQQF